MKTTLRETCKTCGETHKTIVMGITAGADYAVVVDVCNFCEGRQADIAAAEASVRRGGKR